MSAKIVSRRLESTAQPMRWPVLGANHSGDLESPVTDVLEPERSSPAREPQEQVLTQLHGRIVELEASLQRDVRQARDAGFQEGLRAGRDKAAQDVTPVIERMTKAIGEMAHLRARLRREAEADLVALSVAIARRVLRRELSVDPDAIQGLIKAALEKLQSRDLCRVRVHSDQAAVVRQHMDRAGLSGIEVAEDMSLKSGDLILETKRGDLDASIDVQLSEIERGFADRMRR